LKRFPTLKGILASLVAVIGLCAALVMAVNLWIPKQPVINYISSATGGEASFDKVVIGWDWGPDIRIDGLAISGMKLGASQAKLEFAQARLKISFEALWKNLTGEQDIPKLAVQDKSDDTSSGGIENWVIQYFQSLKIIDGTITSINDSIESVVTASLLEIRAFDAESTVIVYEGSVDGVSMMLSGAFAGIRSLLMDNSSAVAIEGYVLNRANTVYAEGMVGDIQGLGDIFLTVHVAVNDSSDLVSHFHGPGLNLDRFSGFSLQFDVSAPDKLDSLSLKSLELQGSAYGINVRVLSEPGEPITLDDIDLELEAAGTVEDSGLPATFRMADNLNVSIKGRISGSPGQIAFVPSEALIEGQGINASLDGRLELLNQVWSMDGTVEAEFTKDAAFIPPAFDFLLPVNLNSKLQIEPEGLVLDEVKLSSNQAVAKQARVTAIGKLSTSASGMNGHLKIDGFFDREGLLQLRQTRLPQEIQLEARTTLGITDSQPFLDQIDLVGRLPGIKLDGVAFYSLSDGFDSMTIEIQGQADSAKSIGKAFRKNWPDTSPVLASTVLRKSADENWLLDDFHVEVVEDDLEIAAHGSVRVFGIGDIGMFNIKATAGQSTFMEKISKSDFLQSLVSPIVPLRGTAGLHLEREPNGRILFDLRSIEIESEVSDDLASATGYLDSIQSPNRKGLLSIRIRDSQGRYSGLLDAEHVERHPILAESLEADLNLVFDKGQVQINDLSVNLLNDDARIEATGSFETLNPMITQNLNIDFKVQELSQLNRFAKNSRFQKVPAEGQLKVANNPDGIVEVHLKGKLREQDLTGEFKVDYSPSGKHDIEGYLQTHEFSIEKIFQPKEKDGPFFSDRELDLSWLDGLNLDLELDIGHYRGQVFMLQDLSGDFRISDGTLRMNVAGHAENKPVEIAFNLHPAGSGWKSRMSIQGDSVDVDALDHNFRGTENLDSVFSIDLDLTAEGHSMSEMASSANGHFNFEVSDVGVKVGESFVFGDLIFGMFNLILSLQFQEDFDLMECGVASFRVQDGIAFLENSLALKMKDFTILGSGQVDLPSEKLDIVFSSKARKGLGISINTVAKLFKVGGTLRNPELVADAEGLAKTGASLFAGFLTGGLSVVAQGLFDREIANSDVCEVARSSNAS